jgi:hypothetical protein
MQYATLSSCAKDQRFRGSERHRKTCNPSCYFPILFLCYLEMGL